MFALSQQNNIYISFSRCFYPKWLTTVEAKVILSNNKVKANYIFYIFEENVNGVPEQNARVVLGCCGWLPDINMWLLNQKSLPPSLWYLGA